MASNGKGSLIKYIFTLLILAIILVAGWLMVRSVNTSIQQAVSPLNQANQTLRTQVSGLLNPTPTIIPDPITIIYKVRSLARLETIQYSLEKVITAEVNQGIFGPLVGDKLLFVAHGQVIAGVDLSKLSASDLKMENGVLKVKLPEAEIFVATLDNQKSYVYDRDTGLFTKGMAELETKARQAAEEEIHKSALQDGILDQAQVNAELFLERMFNNLGYEKVEFIHPEE